MAAVCPCEDFFSLKLVIEFNRFDLVKSSS